MKKITKKDIRSILEASIYRTLLQIEVSIPSKKTKRIVKKVSKELSGFVKDDMKGMKTSRKAKVKKAIKKESSIKTDVEAGVNTNK